MGIVAPDPRPPVGEDGWTYELHLFALEHERLTGERFANVAEVRAERQRQLEQLQRGETRAFVREDWDLALSSAAANLRESRERRFVAPVVEVLDRAPESVRASLLPLVGAVPGSADDPGYEDAVRALADGAEQVAAPFLERRTIETPPATSPASAPIESPDAAPRRRDGVGREAELIAAWVNRRGELLGASDTVIAAALGWSRGTVHTVTSRLLQQSRGDTGQRLAEQHLSYRRAREDRSGTGEDGADLAALRRCR